MRKRHQQPQHTNHWAPQMRKRHHQEHRRSGRQNAATRRNMRREERVTVRGPVKRQQPDGMPHGAKADFLPLEWPIKKIAPLAPAVVPTLSNCRKPGSRTSGGLEKGGGLSRFEQAAPLGWCVGLADTKEQQLCFRPRNRSKVGSRPKDSYSRRIHQGA